MEGSLNSILNQIDENFEVIVVDAKSTDGSSRILKRFEKEGRINLIVQKCTRGKGRQIAFENSSGDYIIANLDTDELYAPKLIELLSIYHHSCSDKTLLVTTSMERGKRGRQNVTIAPRGLVEEIGGWRDLNYAEDWDFWCRASTRGKFATLVFPLVNDSGAEVRESGFMIRYNRYVSFIFVGRDIFKGGEALSPAQRFTYLIAKVAVAVSFKPELVVCPEFDPYSKTYQIQGYFLR